MTVRTRHTEIKIERSRRENWKQCETYLTTDSRLDCELVKQGLGDHFGTIQFATNFEIRIRKNSSKSKQIQVKYEQKIEDSEHTKLKTQNS